MPLHIIFVIHLIHLDPHHLRWCSPPARPNKEWSAAEWHENGALPAPALCVCSMLQRLVCAWIHSAAATVPTAAAAGLHSITSNRAPSQPGMIKLAQQSPAHMWAHSFVTFGERSVPSAVLPTATVAVFCELLVCTKAVGKPSTQLSDTLLSP